MKDGVHVRRNRSLLSLLLSALILASFASLAIPPSDAQVTEWIRQFGTPQGDELLGLSVDSSGIYVAGTTEGTLPGQTLTGYQDGFVRKYSLDGRVIWTHQFGSDFVEVTGITAGMDRDEDAYANGIYVTGIVSGALPGQVYAGSNDAFLQKYSSHGRLLWTRQFGTPDNDYATAVSADRSGIYVAGFEDGTLPGQNSAGLTDAFIRKYNPGGQVLWTRQFGTPRSDGVSAIFADAAGIYVAGTTSGPNPDNTFAEDIFFVGKFTASGGLSWTRQFGGPIGSLMVLSGIDVDDASIYLVGGIQLSIQEPTDAFIRKYDIEGNQMWAQQFGDFEGPSSEFAEDVSVDNTGVYVTGHTDGIVPGEVNYGKDDFFVRKYDTDGNVIWTRQFGSSANDYANVISAENGEIYLAGSTGGVLPGQTPSGDPNDPDAADAFVAKLSVEDDQDDDVIMASEH